MRPLVLLAATLLLIPLQACTSSSSGGRASHSSTASSWRREPNTPAARELLHDLASISESTGGVVDRNQPATLHYEVVFYTPSNEYAAIATVIAEDQPDGTVYIIVHSHAFTPGGRASIDRHAAALNDRCRHLFAALQRRIKGDVVVATRIVH